MPDTTSDVIRPWAGTVLGRVTARGPVPVVGLKVPDCLGEEAGGNQIQEAGADDQKDLQRGHVATLVDDETDEDSSCETTDGGQGDGAGGQSQADTSDKDNGLETFSQNGNEGKQEHGVFFCPGLEAGAESGVTVVFGFESLCQLDSPFGLQLGDAEQGGTDDGDDDGRNDGKDAFPDVFCWAPFVLTDAVKGTDQPSADNEAYEEAYPSPPPYLKRIESV